MAEASEPGHDIAGLAKPRRHRLLWAAVLVTVVVAGAVAVATRPAQKPAENPPAPLDWPAADVMPPRITTRPTPVDVLSAMPPSRPGLLPQQLATSPAVPLSADPVHPAQALFQPYRFEPMVMTPVYVLGADGRVRELDTVDLDFVPDPGGNLSFPLRPTSLSPDGLAAAFPQRGRVVLVDLTTGQVQVHDVPTYVEHVVWVPGPVGRPLLVGDERKMFVLTLTGDLASLRHAGDVPLTPRDVAAMSGTDLTIAELRDPTQDQPAAVRTWWREPAGESERPIMTTPDLEIMAWSGRGWSRGPNVARSAFLRTPTGEGEHAMAVVDHGSGEVVRWLRFTGSRRKGCCQPLGWLDDATVLLATDLEGVVSWNLSTGELLRRSDPFDGVIALRDGNPN